jgi:pyridoxine 5-phosphate synthase
MTKTKLSVNINKVALIRNSRGGNLPDLIAFAKDCENFGAEGITVHPRPDQRHVRDADVFDLKSSIATELNVEGYPDRRFMRLIEETRPHQCTLVPDLPGALTSDHGWDIVRHRDFLKDVLDQLRSYSVRSSLFIDPEEAMVVAAKEIGADRVELYTGLYAKNYLSNRKDAIQDHVQCGVAALDLQIGLNAGHDLNLDNLKYYSDEVPGLLEVSIGHALITDALYYGISNTISMYKALLS